jgi:hypothetical protein
MAAVGTVNPSGGKRKIVNETTPTAQTAEDLVSIEVLEFRFLDSSMDVCFIDRSVRGPTTF